MSWITEIAGKAENFLNKIDQNAAVALNSVDLDFKAKSRSKPTSTKSEEYIHHTLSVPVASSVTSLSPRDQSVERASGSTTSTNINASNAPGNSSKLSLSGATTTNRSKPARKKGQHLEHSSSNTSLNGNSKKSAKATDEELLDFLNSIDNNQSDIDVGSLMKTELDSQKREMGLLLQNHRKLQKDYEALKTSIEPNPKVNIPSSLPGENTELALVQSESDNRKLLEGQILQKDLEIHRLTERLDQALVRLESMGELQTSQSRIQLLERDNRQLTGQHQELTSELESLAAKLSASENHSKTMKEALSVLESEFMSYKDKAKSLLKNKDDLIASLKAESGSGDGGGSERSSSGSNQSSDQFLSEIGFLRNERELLVAEIGQSRVYIESMREETTRVEEELQTLRVSNSNLTKLISKDKKRSDLVQEENLQLSQEISSLQLLLERERIEGKKAQEKWEKFSDQNSNSVGIGMSEFGSGGGGGLPKSNSLSDFSGAGGRYGPMQSSGYSDMDETENLRTRIAALSQSLLEKQGLINNLSSDKQLLQIRCERMSSQLLDMDRSTDSLGSEGSITHSVVSSQPLYLSESPWDSRIATRVKRVYSTMDSFCCQIGLVLRQRPNLRLGFCVYILCLHLWVFLILFTWVHHSTPVAGSK